VDNIGQVLKLIYDSCPEYKIITTGSSSFDLTNKIVEPLTGRNVKFQLFTLSIGEIRVKNGWLWILENLPGILMFGTYPGIIDLPADKKIKKLDELSSDYLFKDILAFEMLKNSGKVRNLVKALALQTGNLVSMHELSIRLGITVPTVEKYIDLLEKTFVIFSLGAYSSNLRNEIRKSRKFYFYDTGLRNAVIANFSLPENRQDTGALWENFCIAERVKYNQTRLHPANLYFWRTYDGAEIDLVEESEGKLDAFEFKWNPKKMVKLPSSFKEKYTVRSFRVINPENFHLLYPE
jgi:predicted AAA+ superfamily ATPase